MPNESRALILEELNRLESLRDPGKASNSERVFDRAPVRGQGDLRALTRGKLGLDSLDVELRDCSIGGVGLICTRPLDVGSAWRMTVFTHGYPSGEQHVIVRHCRRVSAGVYLCGGQYCASPGLLSLMGCSEPFVRAQFVGEHGNEIGTFLSPEDLDGTAA